MPERVRNHVVSQQQDRKAEYFDTPVQPDQLVLRTRDIGDHPKPDRSHSHSLVLIASDTGRRRSRPMTLAEQLV